MPLTEGAPNQNDEAADAAYNEDWATPGEQPEDPQAPRQWGLSHIVEQKKMSGRISEMICKLQPNARRTAARSLVCGQLGLEPTAT